MKFIFNCAEYSDLNIIESDIKNIIKDSNEDGSKDLWSGFGPIGLNEYEIERYFGDMDEIYPRYMLQHNIRENQFHAYISGKNNEHQIPHIHLSFRHKNEKEDLVYIRLDKAKYYTRHNGGRILTSEEKQAFIKFINTPIYGYYVSDDQGNNIIRATAWIIAYKSWKDNYNNYEKYFKFDDNGIPIMPDYSKL